MIGISLMMIGGVFILLVAVGLKVWSDVGVLEMVTAPKETVCTPSSGGEPNESCLKHFDQIRGNSVATIAIVGATGLGLVVTGAVVEVKERKEERAWRATQ